jgi:hypothetical protein
MKALIDINGVEIKLGDTVKTQQPKSRFLPQAEAKTGVVRQWFDLTGYGDGTAYLAIKFKNVNEKYGRYILLDGKINEVIK